MTNRRDPNAEAAMQYLVWALEEIEKSGHQNAAQYARLALEELRGVAPAGAEDKAGGYAQVLGRYAEEAKRFRDKADEAEQLAELAETPFRRDSLLKIAEVYRRTAERLDRSWDALNAGRVANS